ncbi:MAG: hypothetical protein JRE71_01155 [Deltaproteobacteria bacterium]|nr:hypothetical protein [Deltaproteobacteria bacterium]
MTLQDLGNIGEFVGAIGVVASFIYLALQIRQNSHQIAENTNSLLGSVEQENAMVSSDFLLSLAQDPDLARVWRVGLSESATLTEDEGTQFVMLMGAAFYRLEGPFRQYKRGLLSEDSWQPWDRLISRYLGSPAVLAWWLRRDVPFAESFIEYVDSRIPASSRHGSVPTNETLPPVWPDTGGSQAE